MSFGTVTPLVAQTHRDISGTNSNENISATAVTFFGVDADNRDNSDATYVKAWDALTASVTVGTTPPDWVWKVAAGARRPIILNDGHGQKCATGLQIAAVTTAGTAGTTSPTNAVPLKVYTGTPA